MSHIKKPTTSYKLDPSGNVKIRYSLKPLRKALSVGGIFVILSTIYIIVSTEYVTLHAENIHRLELSELQKGIIYVWVTGALLTALLWSMFKKIDYQQERIIEQRNALLLSERQAIAGMLASSVAHDINNVLTTTSLAIHMIDNNENSQPSVKKNLELVRAGHERLTNLARQLMTTGLSRAQTKTEHIILNDLLLDTIQFTKSHQDVKYCEIKVDIPAKMALLGHREMIQQLFFNLILNAGQATEGKGNIYIKASKDNLYHRVEVHDNGPGVPESQRELILEPFYTTKLTGTGLGMLSVQACVEAHKGEMHIGDSEYGGAIFEILFPHSEIHTRMN